MLLIERIDWLLDATKDYGKWLENERKVAIKRALAEADAGNDTASHYEGGKALAYGSAHIELTKVMNEIADRFDRA